MYIYICGVGKRMCEVSADVLPADIKTEVSFAA